MIEVWKRNNRYLLPINIHTWQIKISNRRNNLAPHAPARLGKYQSERAIAISFYKSISRLVNLPQYEAP